MTCVLARSDCLMHHKCLVWIIWIILGTGDLAPPQGFTEGTQCCDVKFAARFRRLEDERGDAAAGRASYLGNLARAKSLWQLDASPWSSPRAAWGLQTADKVCRLVSELVFWVFAEPVKSGKAKLSGETEDIWNLLDWRLYFEAEWKRVSSCG